MGNCPWVKHGGYTDFGGFVDVGIPVPALELLFEFGFALQTLDDSYGQC